jgi:Autotransporter beta-domain
MRRTVPRFSNLAVSLGITGLFAIGYPAQVRAQTIFCPPPFFLLNGSCTDGNDGAFSGAALASQALTEVSQTTTQVTTKEIGKAIVERREQERERMRRPVRPARAVPPERPKPAAVVRKEPPPPLLPVPIEPAARFGTWTQVYGDYQERDAAGPGTLTCCFSGGGGLNGGGGGPPGPGGGGPINPAVAALLTSQPPGGGPPGGGLNGGGTPLDRGLALNIESRASTVGFVAGADFTSWGLYSASDGFIAGVTAGYTWTELKVNTTAASLDPLARVGTGVSRLSATLSGPTAGLYATYFNAGFSSDVTVKFDFLTVDETFNDVLATTGGLTKNVPAFISFAGGGSVNLLNSTIVGNLNYRFDLYPNFWVEPTVGAAYTNSSYGSGAAQLGLANGNLVRVQGGARFGTSTLLSNGVLMTTTVTGLAYSDVVVQGGVIPVSAFQGNNLLAQSDEGFMRGQGILALNFDFGNGMSWLVRGDVYGGAHLFGAGGRAGIRYQW